MVGDAWSWGWTAVAAVATSTAVVIAVFFHTWDAIERLVARRRRRRVLASALIHSLALSRHHLDAVGTVLAAITPQARADATRLGAALLNPHAAPINQHLGEFELFGAGTACDLAYGTALAQSIDTFGHWLCALPPEVSDDEWQSAVEHADLFAKDAEQARQSIDRVVTDVRRFALVPR